MPAGLCTCVLFSVSTNDMEGENQNYLNCGNVVHFVGNLD